jgi:hypothetical protein
MHLRAQQKALGDFLTLKHQNINFIKLKKLYFFSFGQKIAILCNLREFRQN